MKMTTPTCIDETILDFCNETLNGGEPVFVPVVADEDSVINECFHNVERKINKYGGSIVYGWIIWIAYNFIIQGEFHAVWKSNEGNIVDITTKQDGEDKILFVEEKIIKFNGSRVKSKFKNISNDAIVDSYIDFDNVYNDLIQKIERIPMNQDECSICLNILNAIDNAKNIIYKYIEDKNILCPCGCGNKFVDHEYKNFVQYVSKLKCMVNSL